MQDAEMQDNGHEECFSFHVAQGTPVTCDRDGFGYRHVLSFSASQDHENLPAATWEVSGWREDAWSVCLCVVVGRRGEEVHKNWWMSKGGEVEKENLGSHRLQMGKWQLLGWLQPAKQIYLAPGGPTVFKNITIAKTCLRTEQELHDSNHNASWNNIDFCPAPAPVLQC